jgi:hypothetical protein
MPAPKTHKSFSLTERLAHGNLTLDEVCELKPRSRSGLYEDARAGLLVIEKHHRRSLVRGPIARAYIEGASK